MVEKRLDAKWSEILGPVFKGYLNTGLPNHLKTEKMDAIFFSYVLVWYLNGQSST